MPVDETGGEPAQPEPTVPPKKGGKKLWVMIVAVLVAVVLISAALYVMFAGEDEPEFVVTFSVDGDDTATSVTMAAGSRVTLEVDVTRDGVSVIGDTGLVLRWSVSDDALGTFNVRAQPEVEFTALNEPGEGVLNCSVTYTKDSKREFHSDPSMTLTVEEPGLDSVLVVPSTKTVLPDTDQEFEATVINTVGDILPGAVVEWTVSGLSAGDYTLSATTGSTVTFSASVTGTATLTAETTVEGETKDGSATVIISDTLPGDSRTVDYYWYDMFNVPFGEWWDLRYEVYGEDEPISDSYPYMFIWYGSLEGNTWIYTNIRMSVTGQDMTDINMNENPEFLPLLGIARGGTAEIDWYMQYLTTEDMARYPDATAAWSDGWVVSLNGTVTLDKTAAMAVLNVTQAGWDDFGTWWDLHGTDVEQSFSSWFTREAGRYRLDIYNMYEYPLTILTWELGANKVGDEVVLKYDMVTWGVEALMTRWLHEAFMPTEWYFEDMNLHATIGPESSTVDIDTVACYSAYAYEATVDGSPCWSWESLLQDYVPSTFPAHPKSDYDPYVGKEYWNFGPGSWWYGTKMEYDYAPGIWNLSAGESLTLTWPEGDVLFPVHVPGDVPRNNNFTLVSGPMTVEYAEPIDTVDPDLAASIAVDTDAREITYTGPIDFWSWLQTQTTHQNLSEQYDELEVLPWGLPYVEFVLATEPEPTSFELEPQGTVKMDTPADVVVTCLDQRGRVYTDYAGTVTFYSNDTDATLPGNYPYVAGDNGVHTFSVTFSAEGWYNLTVWDVANNSIIGSVDVEVQPSSVMSDLQFDVLPDYAVTGVSFSATVKAVDQYGDVFPTYAGTVTFTSNDSDVGVVLPSDYPFDVADNGVHEFTDGFALVTSGWMSLNVTDTVDDSFTDEIMLWVFETAADHLEIEAYPSSVIAGAPFSLTVTAYDDLDNVYLPYDGVVHFTSADAAVGVVLAPDYMFRATDMGTHVFAGNFTLVTEGLQSVTVEDLADAALTDTVDIDVSPAPREVTHTFYDQFQEPWGDHWLPRWDWYNDILVGNESGMYFELYLPAKAGYDLQSEILAPFRYSLEGSNITTMNVHTPEFMPSASYRGVSPVAGAEATVEVYYQYLVPEWYNSYWMPGWSGAGLKQSDYNSATDDGWFLGTLYTVTLNREAAEEWLGMPQASDPATWWADNNASYTNDWELWILSEGNTRLDIWNGYEAGYGAIFTGMILEEDLSGDIVLTIGHINWGGYEVLTTRWFTEAKVTPYEGWFEDFSMTAHYGEIKTDLTFDTVVQYCMKAVVANGTVDGCAWVFEPWRIDYIESSMQHPDSDYDLYADITYHSWNVADGMFGEEVAYEGAPQWMNLSEGEKLVIEMPTGDVPGFHGVGLSFDDWAQIWVDWDAYIGGGPYPDFSPIWDMMNNGTAGLEPGYMITNYPDNDAPYTYDPGANTLTFEGPQDFDNFRHSPDGPLYHGAPWIEMNVVGSVSAQGAEPGLESTAGASGSSLASETLLLVTAMSAVALAVAALGASARRRE